MWDHDVFEAHASSLIIVASTTDSYGLAPFDWLSFSPFAKMRADRSMTHLTSNMTHNLFNFHINRDTNGDRKYDGDS